MVAARLSKEPYTGSVSTINFFSMANAKDEYEHALIFDPANQPELAHAVSPKFSQLRALQRLPDRAWVVELGYAIAQELQNARAMLSVEFLELAFR